MYSLKGYGSMIADKVRMDAYYQALQSAVKPGSVVLDIGTGTGAFALLACRLGARKVYAIEPSDAIQVARELAAANACLDRITFIQALSTEIDLPERADVIVADLRGVLPFHPGNISSLADARHRFLAPGGTLIPQSDVLWAACLEAPKQHQALMSPWGENHFGFDLSALRGYLTQQWSKSSFEGARLLSEARSLGSIDYQTVESSDFKGKATLGIASPGTGHGLCLWFDTTLMDGIGFSNAPGLAEAIYGRAFFPWSEPVELSEGDTVAIDIQARLVGDDYLWNWDTVVRGHADAGPAKATFRQSTFFSEALSSASLRKRAATHKPVLNASGELDLWVLQRMAEGLSLMEIADQLMEQQPGRFNHALDALTFVSDLSVKYSL